MKLSSLNKSMKRLQKFERCSYKENARITLNKLFSSEMMLKINFKGNYNEIIIVNKSMKRLQKFRRGR